MKTILREGDNLSPWYAVAYLSPNSYTYVCYPIGIHWIVGLSRKLYNKIRMTPIDATEFLIFNKVYQQAEEKITRQLKKEFREKIPVIIKELLEREDAVLFKGKKAQKGWILKFIEEKQAEI